MEAQGKNQKPPTKCCGLLSVRSLTALMCAVLIICTTSAALAVTYHFSLKAVYKIAFTHSEGLTTSAKNEVENFLNRPLSIVIGWQATFAKQKHLLPNEVVSSNPLWYIDYWNSFVAVMRGSGFKFRSVNMGFEDGSAAFCRNIINNQFTCSAVTKETWKLPNGRFGKSMLTNTYTCSNFSDVNQEIRHTKFNPQTRSWYKYVPHTPGAISWGPVYTRASSTLLIVGVSAAIFNESGIMLGITNIAFSLEYFGIFVGNIVTTQNSASIVIDNYDMLLSSSYSAQTYYNTSLSQNDTVPSYCIEFDNDGNNKGGSDSEKKAMCRETTTSYPYLPLNELQLYHPEVIDNGTDGHTRIMTLNGIDYFISVAPIVTPKAKGMNWRIILFLPANDIIGDIIEGRNLAIYICIGITIVAVIVNFLFVRLLLRPLNTVAEDMYRVASMQDMGEVSANVSVTTGADVPGPLTKKSAEPSLSVLSEIATLQFAFNIMRTELAKIKSYLPQSVLAQLYGGDDFSDEGDVGNDIGSTHGRKISSSLGYSCNDVRSNSDRGSDSSQRRKYRKTPADAATVSSTRSGSNQSARLNTALSLNHRRVTMLSLNIVDYHTTISAKDGSIISRIHTALVSAISSACSDHRGVMDGFQGDRFLASFNAVTNVGNHALQAVYAAHTACKAAKTMHTPLVVTAGVASGSALVGNMGSATIKRFTILGHVVSTAATLERLAKRYRTDGGVLAGGAAVTDVENFFELLTVDAAVLPISTASAGWRARIAAVMSPKSAASDEWMYELQEGSKKSRYGDANLAFAAFLEGDEAEASRIVEQLSDGKHDPDSMSVGDALKKLMTAKPAIDGKRYVSPMTDFYQQCVLPRGSTAATNMSYGSENPLGISPNDRCCGSVLMNVSDADPVGSSGLGSQFSSVSEIVKSG